LLSDFVTPTDILRRGILKHLRVPFWSNGAEAYIQTREETKNSDASGIIGALKRLGEQTVSTQDLNRELLELLPRLERFATSLTRNREEARDLVQDAALKVLHHGVPEGANLKHWAFRVCKNVWIDSLRRKRIRETPSIEQGAIGLAGHDAREELEGRSQLRKTLELMAKLPQDQRLALSLVAIEGMSYREVASVMEVPIGTVMSRVARARASIARALEATEETGKETRNGRDH